MTQDYSTFPTYRKALEDAGLDREVGMEQLLDEPILIKDWTPDSRVVPQTGKQTQGFSVQGIYTKDDEEFTVFVGGEALVKELKALRPPFLTIIRRVGQTYRFS